MIKFKLPKAICKREKCKRLNGGKYYVWTPIKEEVHQCPKCHSFKFIEKLEKGENENE